MSFGGYAIPIPVGNLGFNGNKNVSQLTPDVLIQALNITYENGNIEKEGGSALFTPASLGAKIILGGHDWLPSYNTQRSIIFTSDGMLLKDSGTGTYATVLKSGMTTGALWPPVFVDGGKEAAAQDAKLFIYTGGKNQVQFLDADGVTVSALTTPPVDWATTFPTCGCIHLYRHWGGGNSSNPHAVYFSEITDHTNFQGGDAGQIAIDSSIGQSVSAIISFLGNLLIFKHPAGIFYINTSGNPVIANWQVIRVSKTIGIAGPLAWCNIDDDIMFCDNSGYIHMLSAVREYGDYGMRPLSELNYLSPWIRANLNIGRMNLTQAIFYAAKREAHFNFTAAGGNNNGTRLVFDFNNPQLIKPRYSDKDAIESLWLAQDSTGIERPVGGDLAGQVWDMDQPVKAVNGVGYNTRWQSSPTDFSFFNPLFAPKMKNFKFIEVVSDVFGAWQLSLDIFIDGVYSQTVSITLGASGGTIGGIILGSGFLASDQVLAARRRIGGSGRRISFAGNMPSPNVDFSVASLICGFTMGGDSERQA